MPHVMVDDDDHSIFKIYQCKSPQVSNVMDVPHATEEQLVKDLHGMWDDGWEIEFFFPSGTHILMRRREEWIGDADKAREERQKNENSGREQAERENARQPGIPHDGNPNPASPPVDQLGRKARKKKRR